MCNLTIDNFFMIYDFKSMSQTDISILTVCQLTLIIFIKSNYYDSHLWLTQIYEM